MSLAPGTSEANSARTSQPGFAGAAIFDRYVLSRLTRRTRLRRLLLERITEPLHLNLASVFVALFGTYRAKVACDLVIRQQFAWPLLRIADEAVKIGLKRVSIAEFGVANGAGLLNMCKLAVSTTKATGIEFDVFGFDTGTGMPPAIDHRDHPELWQQSDFPMDVGALQRALPGFARLLIGDVAETIPSFLASLSPQAPLAFVSLDLDYYSSSKRALEVFKGEPTQYLPTAQIYLDDIVIENANPWCGELLAVEEFNAETAMRKIAPVPMVRSQRLFKNARYLDQMYQLHVFDHPLRQPRSDRAAHVIPNEYIG